MGQRRGKGTGPVQIIEESLHVLRNLPLGILAAYFVGSLPFVLGLLYFWADMSRSAFAAERCTSASLGLAALFVWMKFWQAVFVHGVRDWIAAAAPRKWSAGLFLRLAAIQGLLQSTGLFILPIALVMTVPFGWAFAFYQSALCPGQGEGPVLSKTIHTAWRQARLWPMQNHLVLSIFLVLGSVLFINVGFTLFIIPHLVKSLLGFETVFTVSGTNLLNTTFMATALGLSYLCMDPLVKTVYALRCFYGDSIRSGDDLLSELRKFRHGREAGAAVVFVLFFVGALFMGPGTPRGEDALSKTPGESTEAIAISPEILDRSIEKVLERREFTWRMPRVESEEEPEIKGPLATAMDWCIENLGSVLRTLGKWIRAFFEWLGGLLPDPEPMPEGSKGAGWMPSMRTILIGLIVILLAALVFFVMRTLWFKKQRRGPPTAEPDMAVPDLNDEQVTADELSQDRWLRLGKELMERGSLREAMRAIYLGTLSGLSERGVISIAKYKSNRDYREELRRRAHGDKELYRLFSVNVDLFDRAWYGRLKPNLDDLKRFAGNHERISRLVRV